MSSYKVREYLADTWEWKLLIENIAFGKRTQGGDIKAKHRIRIEIVNTGGYSVMDVTGESEPVHMATLTPELRDKMSLMLLLEPDTDVDDLGYRYSQNVFYVNGD